MTGQSARRCRPEDVQAIANRAQQLDPSIIDRAGAFYAQHPSLVKSLGIAALALTMNHMSALV